MGRAKDIIIKPIAAKDANRIIKQLHYSGKVGGGGNSQIHFGVFLDGKCGGALQFGPPINKRLVIGLVSSSVWNGFTELHRMALADWLPRNSESRAISVVIRLLRKHYPHIKWLLSYADATQCGDGAIYRASGFALTGIKKNTSMVRMPDGEVVCKLSLRSAGGGTLLKQRYGKPGGKGTGAWLKSIGVELLEGYQLRYIYFLDPSYRERLTVPEIPYSRIAEMGIGMYKGKKRTPTGGASEPTEAGGSMPTRPLQEAQVV